MSSAELEKVRQMWQGLLEALAPPAGIPEYRDGYESMLAVFPVPQAATIREVDAGGVPALLVSMPGAAADSIVLWTHSGGYVFGSAHAYRFFGAALGSLPARRCCWIDYRLAPGSTPTRPHSTTPRRPTDGRWRRGTTPPAIVVAGDSAGGGLAAATLLALRDDGTPMPAAGVFVSPMADFTLSGDLDQTAGRARPNRERGDARWPRSAIRPGTSPCPLRTFPRPLPTCRACRHCWSWSVPRRSCTTTRSASWPAPRRPVAGRGWSWGMGSSTSGPCSHRF